MTEEEFVRRYAARSNVSIDDILRLLKPEPCDCGEDGCQGWKMVMKENRDAVCGACNQVGKETP